MRTCTRKLEFDAAHRVMEHESKCKNLHGHRYTAEVTCAIEALDGLGRVIDFGVVKEVLGGWIDEHWDHGTILHMHDHKLIGLCEDEGWRYWIGDGNPTAENMARWLFDIATDLLVPKGVHVVEVVLYETPNCWSTFP